MTRVVSRDREYLPRFQGVWLAVESAKDHLLNCYNCKEYETVAPSVAAFKHGRSMRPTNKIKRYEILNIQENIWIRNGWGIIKKERQNQDIGRFTNAGIIQWDRHIQGLNDSSIRKNAKGYSLEVQGFSNFLSDETPKKFQFPVLAFHHIGSV